MHRIDTEGAVANLNGTGKNGFRRRNLSLGQIPTVIDATYLNSLQEEICNLIEDQGITLVKGTRTQLRHAIRRIRVAEVLAQWRTRTSGTAQNLFAATYHDGANGLTTAPGRLVVAGNNGVILTSDDQGVTWTARTAAGAYTGTFAGAAVSHLGVYVLVGSSPNSNGMQRSTDGTTWAAATTVPAATPAQQFVAYSRSLGMFVSVGQTNSIRTSVDGGVTWVTQTAAGSGNLRCVVWTGTRFVVTSDSGNIQVSTDGVNWTSILTASNRVYHAVSHDPISGITLLAGYQTTPSTAPMVRYSLDSGLTWSTEQFLNVAPTSLGNNILYSAWAYDNLFMVSSSAGEVAWSADAQLWTKVTTGFPATSAYHLMQNARIFGIIGASGNIVTSSDQVR